MAWRLNESIVKGEIDNRKRGIVTGRIWLVNRPDPLILTLNGNALRDLAGCLVEFSNPAPAAVQDITLNSTQNGIVGDITGSRRARIPDVSVDEMMKLSKEGKKVPSHLGNILYIEWFSENNGRVVIESPAFHLSISPPEWHMTHGEELEQLQANMSAIRNFLDQLAGTSDAASDAESDDEEEDNASDSPMDEFQWEKFMKESDKRTDRYMKLLEKYDGHPDQEKLVAREMGWTWLEEALEADERGKLDDDDAGDKKGLVDSIPEDEEMEPDPATEGIDWVRDEHGRPQHPLVMRSNEVLTPMWRRCKALDLLGEKGDQDIINMLAEAQIASAKLAGGLNLVAYEGSPEGGFIVACLKRSLTHLHKALGLADIVAAKAMLPQAEIAAFKKALFSIREEILKLMAHYRQKTG